jgi:D-3-phosphoglycerate dehydrogenase
MTGERILITSVFLQSGDEVDQMLQHEGFDTVHSPINGPRSTDELIELIQGIDGVIAGSDPFTSTVLRSAGQLKVIARTGVGYDAIDLAAASEAGVAVCNVPGVNRRSVAELAIAFMLMSGRRIAPNMHDVRDGGWTRQGGRELGTATLGIVGLGAIGKTVAKLAHGFGMTVVAHDPWWDAGFAEAQNIARRSLDELLAESDFVSLHIALTDDTHHLIDAQALARMKPTAHLINTARGPIIDEAALIEALCANRIAGAALDVVEHEPLPADSPLRSLTNVILTAHIGGATEEARNRSGVAAAQSVISLLRDGVPLNVVNPSFAAAAGRAAER